MIGCDISCIYTLDSAFVQFEPLISKLSVKHVYISARNGLHKTKINFVNILYVHDYDSDCSVEEVMAGRVRYSSIDNFQG